ncbi:MAG: transporter substrate-binding protein, partial [Arthrobacter sp.]|nr:transporter substrate-binding protein [Arthrobacter sp.]
ILNERGRNENPAALQYWKSVGVPDKGEIKDEDFTRWNDYLESAGIIKDDLDPRKLYTNEFNGLISK